MPYYPLFLRLVGQKCVVVGGGAVAERKVNTLLECGAAVTVVSSRVNPALRKMGQQGKLQIVKRGYRRGDLKGSRVAIAATNDLTVNAAVAAEGRRKNVLVNVVDDPEHSDFILPSLLKRGELVIAVSTGGESPALAKKIRTRLESSFEPEYAQLVALVSKVREELHRKGYGVTAGAWQQSLEIDLLLNMLKEKKSALARKTLLASLRQQGMSTSRGSR